MNTTPRLVVHFLKIGSCRHCERVTIRGGSLRSVEYPAICALIIHPIRGPFLYDTGYSNRFIEATQPFPERLYRWMTPVHLPPQERLENQLAVHGIALSDIQGCLISHFHADHIAGLRDLPRAQFYALKSDVFSMASAGRIAGLRKGVLPALLPPDFESRLHLADEAKHCGPAGPWKNFGSAYDIFGDGSLKAVSLPGHTPGQMGLLFRDLQDREVFLCADACWSRAAWEERRYPSVLARTVMSSWSDYLLTLDKIHRLGIHHPEIAILPSHCLVSLNQYRAQAVAGFNIL